MNGFRKTGGFAALYEAAAYILGIVFYMAILNYTGDLEPAARAAMIVENPVSMYILTLFVYVLFGVFMVVLSLALYHKLKAGSPAMSQTAAVFGLIWATIVIASGMIFIVGITTVTGLYAGDPTRATTVWLAIESVFEGIGGGVEFVGGIWILLVSWAALKSGTFPKVLNYLGVVIGAAGILTIVPALELLTDVFGLTQIVWFVWLGIVMLKSSGEPVS
jgi:hypothetical protein